VKPEILNKTTSKQLLTMSKNYYDDKSFQHQVEKQESALLTIPGIAAIGNILVAPTSPIMLLSVSAVLSVMISRSGSAYFDHLLFSRPLAGFGMGYWMGKAFSTDPTSQVIAGVIGALIFQLNALQGLEHLLGYGGKRYNPTGKDTAKPSL